MKFIGVLGLLTLIALNVNVVSAWDQDEVEIYDLVEEIGIDKNFYTILKIEQVRFFFRNFRSHFGIFTLPSGINKFNNTIKNWYRELIVFLFVTDSFIG